ncbi:MAG: hypothetical protein HRT52_22100 [Colwellia sp.]|nr:hypothetical protein [Colwellia sp.]NQZ83702.1 hypothetical protein [Colwellia sp.]
MKALVFLLLLTPLSYGTEPVSLETFVDDCDKENYAKGVDTTYCESYLFGFLDSTKLSLGKNKSDCLLPNNAKSLLANLKQAMATINKIGKLHYDSAIWQVLNEQCKISH